MSDVTLDDGEQIFDTENEEVAETANDSEETREENLEEEQEQALNLEPDESGGKDKQIEAWQKKIDAGEATIKDIPPAQKWLKEHMKVAPKIDPREEAKQIALEVIQEERERAKFDSIKDGLDEMSLTRERKYAIQDKFKTFREKGLSKLDALEAAVEVAGVDLSGVSELKRRMRIPTRGATSSSGSNFDQPYGEVYKSVPEGKRQEYLKKLIQN